MVAIFGLFLGNLGRAPEQMSAIGYRDIHILVYLPYGGPVYGLQIIAESYEQGKVADIIDAARYAG